jgi:signal transduction histidine kinase
MKMHEIVSSSESQAPADFVCISNRQLQQLREDMAWSEQINSRLVLAVATAGHDLRQQLHLLLHALNRSPSEESLPHNSSMRDTAKQQIRRVAAELGQLAHSAQRIERRHLTSPCQFRVEHLLNRVYLDWQTEARSKNLQFEMNCNDVLVQSDPSLLSTIVANVVGNAIRYTTAGVVRIDSEIRENCFVLSVWDTGPGIPDSELRRLFARNISITNSSMGLGLGLSIIGRTAALLGLEIGVTTTPHKGTRFRISVPLAGDDHVVPVHPGSWF